MIVQWYNNFDGKNVEGGHNLGNLIGFRINQNVIRPPCAIIKALGRYATPAISDGLNRFNTMDSGIKPGVSDGIRIAGPAITLRLRPGDNLMLHKVLGIVQPGDVLVIDTCGCRNYAVLGELIATAAFQAGLNGIVVDGAVRDICELRKKRFPVFARCVVPSVGDKDGPGEINYPISCGGVPVLPGDIVIGDDNGVVVVPQADAEQILAGAEKKLGYEAKRMDAILSGVIVKPEIDALLRKKGVIE